MRKYSRIFSVLAAIVLPVVAASSALAQQIITVNTTSDNSFRAVSVRDLLIGISRPQT
jgi:hypothetical protein